MKNQKNIGWQGGQVLKLTKVSRKRSGKKWGMGGIDHANLERQGERTPMPKNNALRSHSFNDEHEELADPHQLLLGLYYQARTTADIEDVCRRAAESGYKQLEDRCLEDLAVRRARGTWIATHRRPLPGGAYSNLRNA